MSNDNTILHRLRTKLMDGSSITEQDVLNSREIAKRLNTIQANTVYAMTKSKFKQGDRR